MLSNSAFLSSCASETDSADSGFLSAACGCGGVKTRAGSVFGLKFVLKEYQVLVACASDSSALQSVDTIRKVASTLLR